MKLKVFMTMNIYKIPNYDDYELHYSDEVQLVYSKISKKYLKLCKDRGGYLLLNLSKNGKQRTFRIHQIVWQCIKGNIPTDLEINHKDENKENNCIENLELVTRKENNNHGTRTARAAKAIAKALTNRQDLSKAIVGVKKDLSEILQYPSTHEASRDRGFNIGNISDCCNNKRKSVQGYYWFFKSDFDSYLTKFNNDLEEIIKYKLSLY